MFSPAFTSAGAGWFALLLVALCVGSGRASARPDGAVVDVRLPVFAGAAPRAVGVVHIQRAEVEHLRKGFLTIGLFPILVARGVTVELAEPAAARAALGQLGAYLESRRGTRALELRDFRLKWEGEAVTAAVARFRGRGVWELTGVERSGPAGRSRAGGGWMRFGAAGVEIGLGNEPGERLL